MIKALEQPAGFKCHGWQGKAPLLVWLADGVQHGHRCSRGQRRGACGPSNRVVRRPKGCAARVQPTASAGRFAPLGVLRRRVFGGARVLSAGLRGTCGPLVAATASRRLRLLVRRLVLFGSARHEYLHWWLPPEGIWFKTHWRHETYSPEPEPGKAVEPALTGGGQTGGCRRIPS